jgi:hypothetical protein
MYFYNDLVFDNRDNKAVLYKDGKILFMGNSWSGIQQFLSYSSNASEVREMFKAQLEQREKPRYAEPNSNK